MPAQGEIYWVDLEPSAGNETQKKRPCLVLNATVMDSRVWIVAPFLKYKPFLHGKNPLFIHCAPSATNGLDTDRTPDLFQMRAVDFPSRVTSRKIGHLEPLFLQNVLAAARQIFT